MACCLNFSTLLLEAEGHDKTSHLDVSIPLGVVDGPELGSALAVLDVGPEDGPGSLPLSADDTTHFALWDGVFFATRTFVTRPVKKT